MRSPITISSERGTAEYVTEMESHYHNFKDDPSRLCELLLAHERKKNDCLVKHVRQLECHESKAILASQTLGEKYTLNQLRDEMLDNRLPEFAAFADGLYHDALVEHYSDFQPNSALLSNSQLLLLYQKIQTTFPMHFASLHSMIYGKRSQEPARAQSQYNLDKRFVLIHYFFCLLRERDRHILTHWAIVATVALHYRGVDNNVYRNTAGRSSTTDLHYAIEKLDDIFLSTAPTLRAIFMLQRFIRHVLDNYNRFLRFSTQRCGTSGIFHNGIVFSAILAKEFNKPRGTILMNKEGKQWRVLTSFLSVDYRYNYVDVELVPTKSSDSLTGESDPPPTHVAQQTITLPSLQWKVVSMPGQSDPVPCTYINQEIPSSLRQRVPTQLRDCDLILGDRSWMAEIQSTDESRKLGVREYASLVQDATELLNMIMMIKQPLHANYNTADYENLSKLKRELKSNLLDPNPSICANVEQFQKHCCEYFNESYHAVDRYVWLPLLPKNEMLKDELFLATLSILEQFGVIDNSTGTPVSIDSSNSLRRIFQFGDVLTQQKLHHLNPSVLKKMTHIGNEGNAKVLHSLLTKTCVRNHDYLHENIHRLQGIYKIYVSGFINVCASVIGTKRVGMDPTKGRWRDHEHMVQKMVAALHRLRFDKFLIEEVGDDDIARFNSNINQEARLWSLHKKYKAYCQSLSMSCNEVTKYVNNFMTIVDKWEACKQAVRIGDWSVLEVEAIDWLPVWGLVKKPLYSMETMRRMEINYGLSAEELEYMRMGRLFRMHPNGKFMSLDDFCEKHNYAMKQCSNHPDIQVMCAKSRHLHVASRCAKMMFGNEGRKASSTPKVGDDVDALHKFYVKCNVFCENNVPCALTDLTFAKEVVVEQFNNSKQRAAIDLKRNINIDVMEKNLLKSLKGGETTVVRDIDDESDHSDSEMDDASHSSNPFNGIDDESLLTINTEDGASIHDEENDIGATTTGAMGKINKLGLRNVFSFDTVATMDVIQKRLRTVKEEKEWQKTIHRCVSHFQTKMERKISLLKFNSETRHDRVNREESLHEMEMRLSRERYMGV